MLDSETMRIILLGKWGFYGRTIAEMVKKYDGTEYSVRRIYQVLHKAGIRLRDYREGKGDEAASVVASTLKGRRGGVAH